MAEKNATPSIFTLLSFFQKALHEQPGQTLEEFWGKHSNVPPQQAQLLTPAFLQQQLYGQIARPWERLKRNKTKKSVLKKIMATDWADFEILNLHPTLSRKPMTLSFVLEFLRNAISHDKVRWDKDLNATFADWDSNKLRFSLPELIRFMEAFEAFRQS
ncbi:MAG: hypothetical protein RIC19_05140 [Phaeodactylibacter sp.]|uniref:hypothetical protein n=1 Tax=Phaeodactylibacter sp. TaxID=1940289 RepID=UPI0032EB566B